MGKFFKKFHMNWCLVWNSVFEGSIASAAHMAISSLIYIIMCSAIIWYAHTYSGPAGITLGNEYREIIRHGDLIFSAGHEESSGEQSVHTFTEARAWLRKKIKKGELAALQTSSVPNWIQKMLIDARRMANRGEDVSDEGDGHETSDPLLSDSDRRKLVNPSIAMFAFSSVNMVVSFLLLVAIFKKNVMFMLIWSVIILPTDIVADNAYEIYLFYNLLTMGPLWANTGSIWFEILVVLNFILWITRDLCNLYAFFCITAFRNASTQRRRTNESLPVKRRLEVTLSGALLAENAVSALRSPDHSTFDDDEDAVSTVSDDSSENNSSTDNISKNNKGYEMPPLAPGQQMSSVAIVLAKNGLLRQPSVSSTTAVELQLQRLLSQKYADEQHFSTNSLCL